MGVFGSVKALTILCSLVRNKLIAVWVGPVGVGLVIVYNSIADLVTTTARLNTDQSAMRQVVHAVTDEEKREISHVVRRWSCMMGIIGALIMCILSPALSYWSFGSINKWWTFTLLAGVPLFNSISLGYQSIMQGTGNLGRLARSTMWTALAGIVVSVPLIYFLREQSIIWIIVCYSLCLFVCSWIWRVRLPGVRMPWRQIWEKGREFARLGLWITVGLSITQFCYYLFVMYLNSYSGKWELGLYQAGFTLINTYIGLFFSGVWIEYYPRLTALSHSPNRLSSTVSHRMASTAWVLIPIALAFLVLTEPVVRIIYASTFLEMLPFITLGVCGVILRATSWCMAMVILAKGDGHVYAVTETVSAVICLLLNIVGYSLFGFYGLGASYILWYGAYCLIVGTVYFHKYGLEIRGKAWLPTVAGTGVLLLGAVFKLLFGWWIPLILLLAVAPFCYKRIMK